MFNAEVPLVEAVIAPLDEAMVTLDVPLVIAVDAAEPQVGAAPEPAEVNT